MQKHFARIYALALDLTMLVLLLAAPVMPPEKIKKQNSGSLAPNPGLKNGQAVNSTS